MPFKGQQARGGKRKNAGRKPTAYTQLRKRLESEKILEAEKSFDFYVQVRDNPNEPTDLRMEAATKILDRVLGKAKERIELTDKLKSEEYDKLLKQFLSNKTQESQKEDSQNEEN